MEALTLYLFYIVAGGGPEKRVIQHYNSEKECIEVMQRWKNQSRVTRAWCLTPEEYNAKIGVITTDKISDDRRI